MRTPRIARLFLAALAVACAGTPEQTYPGPERPAEEVAVLRASSNARVVAIDGVLTDGLSNAWALLPGPHELLLRVQVLTAAPNMSGAAWSYCQLTLDAVAGETYASRVRTRQEIAHGLAERIQVEAGVVDSQGDLQALVTRCAPRRPPLEAAR